MDPSRAQDLIDVLIENSRRILDAGFGVNAAESTFFDVVRLLRIQGPEARNHFVDRVRATLESREPGDLIAGAVPVELIELVAHELRWPELKVVAEERLQRFFRGDRTLAIGDVAASIGSAYDDNWRDREFYERYKR